MAISAEKFQRNIQSMISALDNPGKFGFKPEFRKVVAYTNRITRQRFAKHISPAGFAWPKTKASPPVSIGDFGVILPVDPGTRGGRKIGERKGKELRFFPRKIRTARERRERAKLRKKSVPALFRPRGRRRVTRLRRKATLAVNRRERGRIMRITPRNLTMGVAGAAAAKAQFGFPRRQFLGWNQKDQEFIAEIFADGLVKRVAAGLF